MDKFLETGNLPDDWMTESGGKENLNRSITKNKIDLVIKKIKKLPTNRKKKSQKVQWKMLWHKISWSYGGSI